MVDLFQRKDCYLWLVVNDHFRSTHLYYMLISGHLVHLPTVSIVPLYHDSHIDGHLNYSRFCHYKQIYLWIPLCMSLCSYVLVSLGQCLSNFSTSYCMEKIFFLPVLSPERWWHMAKPQSSLWRSVTNKILYSKSEARTQSSSAKLIPPPVLQIEFH